MPKSFTLGNGEIHIGLDQHGQVHDFHFPYVGLENHSGGNFVHKLGIAVDNDFKWLDDPEWQTKVTCEGETLMATTNSFHPGLNISLKIEDIIYNEKNVFIRKFSVTNHSPESRQVKLFFNQQFKIYQSHRGDTAFFHPEENVMIHYKGRRVFLINTLHQDKSFDDYSVGLIGIEGREGTFKDAEDGMLSKNNIEHGLVDSVVGVTMQIGGESTETTYYWITVAKLMHEVFELNNMVKNKTPEYLIETASNYWRAWVNKTEYCFKNLGPKIEDLFKKSLLITRSQIDNRGAIIASGDSDLLKAGRGTYSYVWMRDASLIAEAIDKVGYPALAERYFMWCNDVITQDGYFMHKYRSDKSLGSSWHPWVVNGKPRIPIQEDETALVIYALWQHYKTSKDLEIIERIYNSLIKKAADWMNNYIDQDTGLPLPSYDLWEEKYGIHTFTCAAVYGALHAASNFAEVLGKKSDSGRWTKTAETVKQKLIEHLYDVEEGYFYKMINFVDGDIVVDKTLDMSSIYGVYKFRVLDYDSVEVKQNIKLVEEKLQNNCGVGGMMRYEGDRYFRVDENCGGNPWVITTMWLAQYYIATAKLKKDFEKPLQLLKWAADRATSAGVLSEQFNPYTGEQLSAAPLSWSHGEFILSTWQFIAKQHQLGLGEYCKPMNE